MDINSLERGNEILKELTKVKEERDKFVDQYNKQTYNGRKMIFVTFDTRTVFSPDMDDDVTLLRHKIYDFMINIYSLKIEKLEAEFASL